MNRHLIQSNLFWGVKEATSSTTLWSSLKADTSSVVKPNRPFLWLQTKTSGFTAGTRAEEVIYYLDFIHPEVWVQNITEFESKGQGLNYANSEYTRRSKNISNLRVLFLHLQDRSPPINKLINQNKDIFLIHIIYLPMFLFKWKVIWSQKICCFKFTFGFISMLWTLQHCWM